MELILGPEVISSYKRLSYTTWFALAEFVDNSTQAYFNNRKILNKQFGKEQSKLTVTISYGRDQHGDYLRITDNSIGMSKGELQTAVTVGKHPQNTKGRSRYGLGLKTGACWFGDYWTVETKKLGDNRTHHIAVDVNQVAGGQMDLRYKSTPAPRDEHYTKIEIRHLHRKFAAKTTGKVKDYLRSIYRVDISSGTLMLKWQSEELKWDYEALFKRLLANKKGEQYKKNFRFKIRGKTIKGWAGVFASGSRKEAGFSVIQADRVITGWPDSYRPETIFGTQEGGSNDLVNQRLVGELFLHGFDVSHTKDEVLFDEGDKEILEYKLKKSLAELRNVALTYRKYTADERVFSDKVAFTGSALDELKTEISSARFQNIINTFEIQSPRLTHQINESLKNSVLSRFNPSLTAQINNLKINIYLVGDLSPNDPYVIIESTKSKKSVIVIINLSHPHWAQLTNQESILNFIRHCTYDGVAEWKAFFTLGKLEPDTIKLIKDNLLRVPLQLQQAGD
jgi:hypothetical protein